MYDPSGVGVLAIPFLWFRYAQPQAIALAPLRGPDAGACFAVLMPAPASQSGLTTILRFRHTRFRAQMGRLWSAARELTPTHPVQCDLRRTFFPPAFSGLRHNRGGRSDVEKETHPHRRISPSFFKN